MNYYDLRRDYGNAPIEASWQRLRNAPTWLLTLGIRTDHGCSAGGALRAAWPQANAVMDDFGALVCVTAWS